MNYTKNNAAVVAEYHPEVFFELIRVVASIDLSTTKYMNNMQANTNYRYFNNEKPKLKQKHFVRMNTKLLKNIRFQLHKVVYLLDLELKIRQSSFSNKALAEAMRNYYDANNKDELELDGELLKRIGGERLLTSP